MHKIYMDSQKKQLEVKEILGRTDTDDQYMLDNFHAESEKIYKGQVADRASAYLLIA